MATTLTNYPNSFDKFYYDCDTKCLPRYNRLQPIPNYFPVFSFEIDKTPLEDGFNWQYLMIPYPCDKWDCGEVIDEDYWGLMQTLFGNEFTTATWLQTFNLQYQDNNVWNTINTFGTGTLDVFEENSNIIVSDCGTYGDMCLVIVELKWDETFNTLLASEIIAKSTQKYMRVDSLTTQCGVVGFTFTPNGFGYPVEYTGYYSYWTWGKVWKPSLEGAGEMYIKSNGIRVVLNEQLTEGWTLDIDMNDYSIHKAINVALKCQVSKVYNKDMGDFSALNFDTNLGYNMETMLKEQYTFNYTDKCFSSARGKAIILNNEFSEGISYNC